MRKTIVDSGPLISWLKKSDPDKEWASRVIESLPGPIFTVSPVITEVAYFIAASGVSWVPLIEKLTAGQIVIPHPLSALAAGAARVGLKYPKADLADAAIVSLYEHLSGDAVVVTLDHDDFVTYRTADRKVVDFISPRT